MFKVITVMLVIGIVARYIENYLAYRELKVFCSRTPLHTQDRSYSLTVHNDPGDGHG
jgi:hypothetical protein